MSRVCDLLGRGDKGTVLVMKEGSGQEYALECLLCRHGFKVQPINGIHAVATAFADVIISGVRGGTSAVLTDLDFRSYDEMFGTSIAELYTGRGVPVVMRTHFGFKQCDSPHTESGGVWHVITSRCPLLGKRFFVPNGAAVANNGVFATFNALERLLESGVSCEGDRVSVLAQAKLSFG